jgi:DnaJ-class molecular chaperone
MPRTVRIAEYQCPRCAGEGEYTLLIHGAERQAQVCSNCHGIGVVTAEQWERCEQGRALRRDRVARKMSLAEEARRLGISAVELSDREWGRER